MTKTRTDFDKVQEEIAMVVNDMKSRYPGCHYTVKLLLWDDGTSSIECRHGRDTGTGMIICVSTYYEGELTHEEYAFDFDTIKIDARGNEYNIKNNESQDFKRQRH